AIILTDAAEKPHDFADLSAWWANGIEVWLPSPALRRPRSRMGLIADTLAALTPDAAPITVKFNGNEAPAPTAPFIAVSNRTPSGATARVRFDRGRVVVADRK